MAGLLGDDRINACTEKYWYYDEPDSDGNNKNNSNNCSSPCHSRCSSCSSNTIVVAATGGVIVAVEILSFVIAAVTLISKVSRSAMSTG